MLKEDVWRDVWRTMVALCRSDPGSRPSPNHAVIMSMGLWAMDLIVGNDRNRNNDSVR